MSQDILNELYSEGISNSLESLDSVYSDILNNWEKLSEDLKVGIVNSLLKEASVLED